VLEVTVRCGQGPAPNCCWTGDDPASGSHCWQWGRERCLEPLETLSQPDLLTSQGDGNPSARDPDVIRVTSKMTTFPQRADTDEHRAGGFKPQFDTERASLLTLRHGRWWREES
jgi:hypothetical protein